MSYALGLISKLERDELRTIKSIRNRFAHGLHGLSFFDEEIQKYCKKLRTPELISPEKIPETSRNQFMVSVSNLSFQIELRALAAERERRKEKRPFEVVRATSITIKGTKRS